MTLKGAGFLTDYQNLMKIWTHPWVLKMDEIRQETKVSGICLLRIVTIRIQFEIDKPYV